MWGILGSFMRVCALLYPRRRSMLWPFWTVIAIVLSFLGLQAWFWLRPRTVPLSADQAVATRMASALALDRFERSGGALPATAVVAHLSDDPTGAATEALRAEISHRDGWTLAKGSPVKAFLQGIGSSILDAKTAGELFAPGKQIGIDVVFTGRLLSVSTVDGISHAELEVSAWDVRLGTTVFSEKFTEEYPKFSTALRRTAARQPRTARIVVFFLLVLALPWALRGVVERVREQKSNTASAVLMVGLLACDVLFGLVLFYGIDQHAVLAVLGLLILQIYNLAVCEAIAHRT